MPSLPQPKTCCCCFSLKTGSLIIGVLSLVGSILNMVSWTSGLGAAPFMMTLRKYYEKTGECNEECDQFVQNVAVGIASAVLIVESIQIIISSLMIHGIRKVKPSLLQPFIIWLAIRIILGVALIIALAIIFNHQFAFIISSLISLIIVCALGLHFLFVIYAYKMELSVAQGAAPIKLIEN